MSKLERFRLKVSIGEPSECWIWRGAKIGFKRGSAPYGTIWWGDRYVLAHRAAHMLFIGEIPEGMQVCHRCDNPLCVNPAHLWLGTHAENMADMKSKGRVRSNPRSGEKHHHAVLTDAQVSEIRNMGGTGRSIARMYGVCEQTISDIRNRKKRFA